MPICKIINDRPLAFVIYTEGMNFHFLMLIEVSITLGRVQSERTPRELGLM